MLLNASKDYRRERKERRKNATRQPTHTPEGDEGEPAVEEEQDEDGHPAVDEQEVDETSIMEAGHQGVAGSCTRTSLISYGVPLRQAHAVIHSSG